MPEPRNLLDALEGAAAKYPGLPAIIGPDRTLNRQQLVGEARALGAALAGQTAAPVVALYLPMTTAFVSAFFGTLYAGKTVLPMNMLLPVEELGYILTDSGADLIVTLADFKPKLSALPARVVALTELKPLADAPALPRPKPDDLATLLYTSGSTGKPKGVELTHRNLLVNSLDSLSAMSLTPEHRVLACLPTFHTYAITGTMLAPLLGGAGVVTLPRFDPELALATASQHQCTVFIMVPSMYRLVARRQETRKLPVPLKIAVSGAEPLPAEVNERFQKVFGIPLHEGYGMTETSPVIAVNRLDAHRPGTVGKPLAHVAVRIADPETLQEMPRGEVGEIWVRGESVMRGYHGKPEETAKVLTPDGWLRTGDMGALDADGYLRITGRLREMVKVGGEMVFPAEVENALQKHPAVFECGVVGAKDEKRGESVKAFVVLIPGKAATGDELIEHCRQQLAPYKVPRTIEFRESLPKGPTGKVLRRMLK